MSKRRAICWVAKSAAPRKLHLLDCDYFEAPSKLRRATKKELKKLPECQWCVDRATPATAA
jgi:hypothetical protein